MAKEAQFFVQIDSVQSVQGYGVNPADKRALVETKVFTTQWVNGYHSVVRHHVLYVQTRQPSTKADLPWPSIFFVLCNKAVILMGISTKLVYDNRFVFGVLHEAGSAQKLALVIDLAAFDLARDPCPAYIWY